MNGAGELAQDWKQTDAAPPVSGRPIRLPFRIAPLVLLSASVTASLALAMLMLGLTMDQRWLGLRLSNAPALAIPVAFAGPWIDAADPDGPPAGLPAGMASLIALRGGDGQRISLQPDDLLYERDVLASYVEMQAFFSGQSRIAALPRNPPVALETNFLTGRVLNPVTPLRQHPLHSQPAAFWIQIGVGLVGAWTGAWIRSLRRGAWETRFLALSGAGHRADRAVSGQGRRGQGRWGQGMNLAAYDSGRAHHRPWSVGAGQGALRLLGATRLTPAGYFRVDEPEAGGICGAPASRPRAGAGHRPLSRGAGLGCGRRSGARVNRCPMPDVPLSSRYCGTILHFFPLRPKLPARRAAFP